MRGVVMQKPSAWSSPLPVKLVPFLLALVFAGVYWRSESQDWITHLTRDQPPTSHTAGQPQRRTLPFSGKIEWLHVPKAGTSFGNSLILWACPELQPAVYIEPYKPVNLPAECLAKFRVDPTSLPKRYVGDHVSLTDRTDEELRLVFALLRSPRKRLASGFHYVHKHADRTRASESEICAFAANSTIAHTALGVQTRMIVGDRLVRDPEVKGRQHFVSGPGLPGQQAVVEACRRLQLFAFVGVSDHWNATLCLFHAMYGGVSHDVDYVNVRKGRYTEVAESVKEATCGDTADGQVFECAMEVFNRNLARHPECIQQPPQRQLREEG